MTGGWLPGVVAGGVPAPGFRGCCGVAGGCGAGVAEGLGDHGCGGLLDQGPERCGAGGRDRDAVFGQQMRERGGVQRASRVLAGEQPAGRR